MNQIRLGFLVLCDNGWCWDCCRFDFLNKLRFLLQERPPLPPCETDVLSVKCLASSAVSLGLCIDRFSSSRACCSHSRQHEFSKDKSSLL